MKVNNKARILSHATGFQYGIGNAKSKRQDNEMVVMEEASRTQNCLCSLSAEPSYGKIQKKQQKCCLNEDIITAKL